MEKDLRERIEQKINALGLRKDYVAGRLNLTKSQFSHTLSGRRKLTDLEYSGLKNLLGL